MKRYSSFSKDERWINYALGCLLSTSVFGMLIFIILMCIAVVALAQYIVG